MAVWIEIDAWFRQQESDPLPAPVQVMVEEPGPLPDRFVELLEQLDQEAAAHKHSKADHRGGHYSGRQSCAHRRPGAGPRVLRAVPSRGGRDPSGRRSSCRASRSRTSGRPTAGKRRVGSPSHEAPGREGCAHEHPHLVDEQGPRGAHNGLHASLPAGPCTHRPRPFACWTGCHLATSAVKAAPRPFGMASGQP